MKYLIHFLSAVLLFVCTGCPDDPNEPDSELLVINNSNEIITHYYELKAENDTLLSTIAFPQTPENTASAVILSNDSLLIREPFISVLEDAPNEVLMLYLFSRDTIEQVAWEEIVDRYLVLERYDLTLDSLEARNWTITYP